MRDDVRDFLWGTGLDDSETDCGQPLPASDLFPTVQVHDWTQNPPNFQGPHTDPANLPGLGKTDVMITYCIP